jgi:hypothetical protein
VTTWGVTIHCRACRKEVQARKVQIHARGLWSWGAECSDCGLVHPTLGPGEASGGRRRRAARRRTLRAEAAGQLTLFSAANQPAKGKT